MLPVSLIRSKNEALKKLQFKTIIKCFEKVKIIERPFQFSPIDCCVAEFPIGWEFINVPFVSAHILLVTALLSKLLCSRVFICPFKHCQICQTAKFDNFLNGSSTVLYSVFNVCIISFCSVFILRNVSLYWFLLCTGPLKNSLVLNGSFRVEINKWNEMKHSQNSKKRKEEWVFLYRYALCAVL